jgi:hypothetical protein
MNSVKGKVSIDRGLMSDEVRLAVQVNYCYLLRYQENDHIKRGFQISLSSPH